MAADLTLHFMFMIHCTCSFRSRYTVRNLIRHMPGNQMLLAELERHDYM